MCVRRPPELGWVYEVAGKPSQIQPNQNIIPGAEYKSVSNPISLRRRVASYIFAHLENVK
jgi:hypothetical protein